MWWTRASASLKELPNFLTKPVANIEDGHFQQTLSSSNHSNDSNPQAWVNIMKIFYIILVLMLKKFERMKSFEDFHF